MKYDSSQIRYEISIDDCHHPERKYVNTGGGNCCCSRGFGNTKGNISALNDRLTVRKEIPFIQYNKPRPIDVLLPSLPSPRDVFIYPIHQSKNL